MAINPKFKELPDIEDDDDFGYDDYYDSQGNVSPGGLYDAGGHLIGDRWADYADDLRDRMRDESY